MGHLERLKASWRFNGFQLVFKAEGWARFDMPAFVKKADFSFQLLTAKGMLTGEAGDYLVRFPDGEHAVISAATHAAIESLLNAPAAPATNEAQVVETRVG